MDFGANYNHASQKLSPLFVGLLEMLEDELKHIASLSKLLAGNVRLDLD